MMMRLKIKVCFKKIIIFYLFIFFNNILAKKSPLLPSTSPKVMMRPKSPARRPSAPIHRSSLNAEFLMEIEKRRFSQPYRNTPPSVKKS